MREEGSTSERQSRHHTTVRLGGGETGDLWRCVPALVHVRTRACSSFFKVHVRFARLHVCNVRLPCAR